MKIIMLSYLLILKKFQTSSKPMLFFSQG